MSGGFHPGRIRAFEEHGVPVAGYGVGSSLIGHNRGEGGLLTECDFTGDLVIVDGVPESKIGRRYQPSPRLVRVDWSALEAADA